MTARRGRLEAERDGRDTIQFPPGKPRGRATDRKRAACLRYRSNSAGGREGAAEGANCPIEGTDRGFPRTRACQNQPDRARTEGARELWSKNLIPISKLTALEREAARLAGERGQLISLISETKGKIAETELKILQVDNDMRDEVGKELREVEAKIGELVERKVAAEDQLKHVDIRAPQTGHVHQLAVHTVGGVIAVGEQIMLIVPDEDRLSVEVKVKPSDVDQLRPTDSETSLLGLQSTEHARDRRQPEPRLRRRPDRRTVRQELLRRAHRRTRR